MNRITRTLLACTALIAAMLTASIAPADTITLKDGRVLEGTIEQEMEGFVLFTVSIGGLEHSEWYAVEDIEKMVRSDDDADPDQPANKPANSKGEQNARQIPDGATRVAFISLGDPPRDMVGPFLNADALLHSVELLEELPESRQPEVIVLQINSGGGALLEVEPLMDAITEIKEDYRVVGWIESAISAASLTIFNCEEIYMMREGNVGGTVAYSMPGGSAKALDGEVLEQVLDAGAEISRRGGYDPLVMRAMQVFMTLSCDIDEDGNITWYDDDSGEYLVSPENRILTFNSVDAEKYGISLGTADTKDELAKLMGLHEWVEVGHEADEYQHEFREAVETAQARAGELYTKMNLAVEYEQVSRARRYLRELRALVRKAPSLETYGAGGLPPLTDDFFRQVEEQLDDIAEQQREQRDRRR